MATVRELVTKWGFEVDDKDLKAFETGLEGLKETVLSVGKAAAASAATLVGMAKLTANAGIEISKTSRVTGVATDKLQEYRFAAEQMGFEASQMDSLFFDLNKTMGEARLGFGNGREGIELLARETGTLIDLTGTVDQQFNTIIDGLSGITDEAKRAAVAEKFFGGQGREMASLLDKGSGGIARMRNEFRALGGVMDEAGIKASKDFIKGQTQVLTVIKGIRNELFKELVPVMNEGVQVFKEWFIANRAIVKQNLKIVIENLSSSLKDSVTILKTLFTLVKAGVDALGGFEFVLKAIIKSFFIFKGLKMAMAFGNIVQSGLLMTKGLMNSAKAFKIFGNEALIAQAKAALLPLAITGIVLALALIAEDFKAFSEGRGSVIGDAIGALDSMLSGLTEKFGKFGSLMKAGISLLLGPIRVLVNGFRSISTVMDVISGKVGVMEGLKGIGSRLFNSLTGRNKKGDITGSSLFGLDDTEGARQMAARRRPTAGDARGGGNTNNNVNGKFEINVQGLPPDQAQKAAQAGFADVFGSTLRQAQRDTTPEVER